MARLCFGRWRSPGDFNHAEMVTETTGGSAAGRLSGGGFLVFSDRSASLLLKVASHVLGRSRALAGRLNSRGEGADGYSSKSALDRLSLPALHDQER